VRTAEIKLEARIRLRRAGFSSVARRKVEVQVTSRTERRPARTARNSARHGQRVGRCKVSRRAERVILPGTPKWRRRIVA
jgi:hypothetical protein